MSPAISPGGRRALWVGFWVFVVFLYAPIVVLIVFSFNDRSTVSFPWEGFTLRWYRAFVENPTLLGALRTSAYVALLTGLATTLLAIPAAILLVRRRFAGKGLVTGLLLAPLVIPLIVFGVALLILFKNLEASTGGLVTVSRYTVVVGHTVVALPFAILTIVPRLERIPPSYEEAARDLGADAFTSFRTVTFPLIAPAVVAAFLISVVISFDEIVIASFVAGEDTTFPLYLFSQLRLPQSLPQVIAVAVVVMGVSGAIVVASEVGIRIADRRLEAELGVAAGEVATLTGGTKGAA
ncbi:MAG: spermidine/putrescine ABC transporter [Actinomycetota bacterium]|nr:MAG: spermidine/putrescine ABC transporter [Actinomycetota bacterium]